MKSDAVKTGMQQAPHRSLFNALGMTEEEMRKPLVGIVSSYNEIVPGHMNLDKIVYCHGAYRHEVFPGDPGFDCGFHGVYGAGPSV